MPEKIEKKLLVVRSDILEKLSEVARKENKTLFALTNEILQDALKASEMKTTIREIVDFYRLMKIQKESGSMVIPMNLLLSSLKKSNDKMKILKEWNDAGEWYGKYLIAKFDNPLEILPSLLSTSFWHVSEVKINRKTNDRIAISIIAPNVDQLLIEVTVEYLIGIMRALDFYNIKNDILHGIAILEFSKELIEK
ncbi:MAG: hypothetical protein NZ922_02885 [Candidatus Methanomethyliaceae archaeon]|nr:hypothetical protein [Candidatus Methanomethyliaceae archaeon]MDW7970808.1 hypothetical protein [Nitrososphaerota archaeon]